MPENQKFRRTVHDRIGRGVTLVEMAMVIGVISLVILGSLVALEAVTEQRRMTQAVSEIALIRSAVSKFVAGGLVTYPDVSTDTADDRNLDNWDQIAGFLPGSLGILATDDTDLALPSGNPWSEEYTLVVPAATVSSAKWTLAIGGVPSGLADVLVKQLALNGATAAGNNAGTTGVDVLTACDPSAVAATATTVCVSYEE